MNLQAYIAAIVLLVCVYIAFNFYFLRRENQKMRGDIEGLNAALDNSIKVYKAESGKILAQTKTIRLSQDAARDYLTSDIKKLKEDFGVRINGLKTYTQIGTSYAAPVQAKSRDTIILHTVEKIYSLNGSLSGSVYTKGDSLFGKVVINDTIRVTVSKGKRDRWWKLWEKRSLVTNAFMTNKNGMVTELKSVLVTE